MDEELTLDELHRLEAERKLRTIPAQILDSAWAREAQIEAVIDAVLATALVQSPQAYTHARRVGEWSARIAAADPSGPSSVLARRVGVLSAIDPNALERIPELRHVAGYVHDYQRIVSKETESPRALSLIVAVADEFDRRISSDEGGRALSPQAVLRSMLCSADVRSRGVVRALMSALKSNHLVVRTAHSSSGL